MLLIKPAVTLAVEARGMLSVCVEVELTKAGARPEEPLAKNCAVAFSPFKDVMPVANVVTT